MTNQARFERALIRFDQANAQDPNTIDVDGRQQPSEQVYGQRMSACLQHYAPDASEALRLAARSQHIQRWTIPRSDYPQGRQGYHRWRNALKQFHADTAAHIMREVGYDDEQLIVQVQSLLSKKQLQSDPEMQCLEDVICLVFMQYYFADFAARHSEEKIIGIVQKTWRKLSPRGQQAVLALPLSDSTLNVVDKALAASS